MNSQRGPTSDQPAGALDGEVGSSSQSSGLPIPAGDAAEGGGRAPMDARETLPPTVLVVEDEALIKIVVVEALEERGYRVESASSAAEAVALLEAHCEDIRLLLTDIDLGAGGDGFALARRAREICPALRVIYVSGGVRRPADQDVDGVLIAKPYELNRICDQVATALA